MNNLQSKVVRESVLELSNHFFLFSSRGVESCSESIEAENSIRISLKLSKVPECEEKKFVYPAFNCIPREWNG